MRLRSSCHPWLVIRRYQSDNRHICCRLTATRAGTPRTGGCRHPCYDESALLQFHMMCPRCGQLLPTSSDRCPKCGTSAAAPAAAASTGTGDAVTVALPSAVDPGDAATLMANPLPSSNGDALTRLGSHDWGPAADGQTVAATA